MIAFALSLIGIYCLELRKDRVSFYLILQFLALDAYSILLWDKGPLRNDDLALLMAFYSFVRGGIYHVKSSNLTKYIYAYLIVVVLCALASFIYYQIPFIQIFKAARSSLYVFVFFDLANLKVKEFEKIFYQIFLLTAAASLVYCTQILLGLAPESALGGTGFLGLQRAYNFPPLTPFNCLYISLVYDRHKKLFTPLLVLSFLTLFLVQSRGLILSTFLAIVVGLSLEAKKSNRIFVFIAVIGFTFLLLSNFIFSGETGDKTANDINKVLSGEFAQENFENESDATFSYRLNLLAICLFKTIGDPIRILFGSGLLVEMPLSFFEKWNMLESARYSLENYTFFSPDISLTNIIYNIGLLGFTTYFIMIYTMLRILLNRTHKKSRLEIVGAVYTLHLIVISLNGSDLTWPQFLVVPLMFVQYTICKQKRIFKLKLLLFYAATNGFVSAKKKHQDNKLQVSSTITFV